MRTLARTVAYTGSSRSHAHTRAARGRCTGIKTLALACTHTRSLSLAYGARSLALARSLSLSLTHPSLIGHRSTCRTVSAPRSTSPATTSPRAYPRVVTQRLAARDVQHHVDDLALLGLPAAGASCEAGVRTGDRELEGGKRETDRNGSAYPPCWWNSMTCWPFSPRVCCVF